MTCFQFQLNGAIKKAFTGGEVRPLSGSEQMAAGFGAGTISALLCSPMELIMIQQQRKGGSLPAVAAAVRSVPFRGLLNTCMREGIFTAGYLGVGPLIKSEILARYPETLGKTEDRARVGGAIAGGAFACYLSHPFDTAKTCMQGDIERQAYRGNIDTFRTLYAEGGGGLGGIQRMYRGAPWRLSRQICCVFILDKVRTDLAPMFYPDAFEDCDGCGDSAPQPDSAARRQRRQLDSLNDEIVRRVSLTAAAAAAATASATAHASTQCAAHDADAAAPS